MQMASLQGDFIFPALKPPPGVTPHFVITGNPTKTAPILVAICVPTATAFVWARMYTKIRLLKSHGWDDYTCFIAWIGLVIYSAFYIKTSECGSGIHRWNLPFQRIEGWAQWNNSTEIVYSPTILATKLSILFMYLRLFMPVRQRKTSLFTQFIIWFDILFYLSILIVSITGCVPRHKLWHRWVPGKCVNEQALLLVTAVINVFSDLSTLILPIGCIWRLQLSLKRKLAVSAIFATGSVACAASIMRVVISVKNYRSEDFTYTLGSQGYWAYVEVVVGIICGCIPVLPGFFRHVVPKVTQKLSYHCSKFRDLFSRFFPSSRITSSSAASYRDSEGDSSCGRHEKGEEFSGRLSQFDCP